MKTLLALLAITLLFTGCATHYSTSKAQKGKTAVIYRLSEQQALSLIATNMAISFPDRPITETEGIIKGYKVRTRNITDIWRTTALAIPVTGQTADGRTVSGYQFDISGSGTQVVTGRPKMIAFKNRLFSDLDQSGAGIPVLSVRPKF